MPTAKFVIWERDVDEWVSSMLSYFCDQIDPSVSGQWMGMNPQREFLLNYGYATQPLTPEGS